MRLADLRRLTIRKHVKIHFRMRNGMECIVNEDGVAQVPALKGIPDFNLEEELAAAGEFLLDPPPPARPRNLPRAEVVSMTAPTAATPAHEHEDE
jgi:hypothetical protein